MATYLRSQIGGLKAGDVVRAKDGRRGTIDHFAIGDGDEHGFINFGCGEWGAYSTNNLQALPTSWGTEYTKFVVPTMLGAYAMSLSRVGLVTGDMVQTYDGRQGMIVEFLMHGHTCRYEVVRIDFGNGEVTEYFSCDTTLVSAA